MRLRWTPIAADDLEAISLYLLQRHPDWAESTVRTLYDAIRSLPVMPNRGRPGDVEGTRELVLPPLPYIIVYRLHRESVEVLRIWHSSQDRPGE